MTHAMNILCLIEIMFLDIISGGSYSYDSNLLRKHL